MSSNLATKLREGTKKSHTMAENTGFVACFLKGTVEKNSYRKLVSNLYYVYTAMEEEMEKHKSHPILSQIYFPELNRKEALEKDLVYYYGSNWRDQISCSPAAQAYVDQLRQVSATAPELLVAHSYTRYLGDLSGGQILKGIAVRGMNLVDGEGTHFYEFPTISDEKAFKQTYKDAMDNLPVDEAGCDRIVEEANDAFGLNMVMFKELEGNLVKAIGVMLFNTLTRRRRKGSTEETEAFATAK
jgi:heme oxygenase (biliverdin-producing, ferredoxin)